MNPHVTSSRSAGFSLVEVIVAATLLALLSSLLLGGLHLGVRVMEAGNRRQDRTERLTAAYNFMRQQLARAQPMFEIADAENRALMFDGAPDRVTVVSIAPDYLFNTAYQRLTIRLEHNASGKRLVARWRAMQRWTDGEPPAHTSILLSGLAAAEFTYFGQSQKGGPGRWASEWRSPRALPLLVRVHLAFADGDVAPDLTVALRLADALGRSECASSGDRNRECGAGR